MEITSERSASTKKLWLGNKVPLAKDHSSEIDQNPLFGQIDLIIICRITKF